MGTDCGRKSKIDLYDGEIAWTDHHVGKILDDIRSEGLEDEGLKSMSYELKGLLLGGGLFTIGWAIEIRLGRG